MKQTHVLKFNNGRTLICRIDISAVRHLVANNRVRDTAAAIRAIDWNWGKEAPTPDMLPEYRPFAQKMYGTLAETLGARMLIKGPSAVNGVDEGWLFKPDGTFEIVPLGIGMAASPEARADIDLDHLQTHGILSQRDAQNMHVLMCVQAGMVDQDAIEAAWGAQNPGALWNCPPAECDGPLVRSLTGVVLGFMRQKNHENQQPEKQNDHDANS